MNPYLEKLQPYPFERLRALLAGVEHRDGLAHIPLSLGEPKHPPPDFVVKALMQEQQLAAQLATYPATKGTEALREAICGWLQRRFEVSVNPSSGVLPVYGTREALFSVAQALLSGHPGSRVAMPNPFYQIYEGAALLAGAEPVFINGAPSDGGADSLASLGEDVLGAIEMVYICSPGNPTGEIMSAQQMQNLIEAAHRYDFVIVSDECYAELYFDDRRPPPSLLSASKAMGNPAYARCLAFHSLSKRSNLPGLRSGFVAGDPNLIQQFLCYRTYHGCALTPHHQHVSAMAWADDEHVAANRQLYRDKFAAVGPILEQQFSVEQPEAGFYHWLETPIDDQIFCQRLFSEQHITTMPGSFLARQSGSYNPGKNRVRLAWVAPMAQCIEAAERLVSFGQGLWS